ncbi:ion transporter [Paraliomyxa miuraensis]|uniref:ion transporter n=1 Tax=Paraliomyxa miuraensis TaxID=376150 RepID=UPI00224ED853|nr:ion transporter [Paraliomyxa miuraensis]MCX4246414.1 ion transporter [Paraliomyxa miuraensis]
MASPSASPPPATPGLDAGALRDRIYIVIFEAETPGGKLFDVALLWLIVASVVTVALESVESVAVRHGTTLRVLEWFYTALFSVEYGLRIYSARRRLRYVVSFFGIIDLLALLPTYLSLFLPGMHTLLVIRALRLLRVFRVLKVVRMMGEAHSLLAAIRISLPKISVFVGAVVIIALVVGAAMYLIEGIEAGFTSIPRGMYWAIVTMTTVGYGDIAPKTDLGQFLAACLMVLGYGILAVPTGIVSAEIVSHHPVPPPGASEAVPEDDEDRAMCHACGAMDHPTGANFCYVCGSAVD